jgi:hypothetical protein
MILHSEESCTFSSSRISPAIFEEMIPLTEVRTTRKTGGLLTAISRCYQASVSRRWLSLSAVRLLALRLQPHSFVQALLLLTRSSP